MIRVLVAEDSPTARTLLRAILESEPRFKVVGEAANGAEAVLMAARLQPDLVTMDIQMPVMDGLEATRRIMSETPVPILVVSSSTILQEVNHAMDAIAAGALMVIEKPEGPDTPRFEERRRQLVSMAKAMAEVKVVRRWTPREVQRFGPGVPSGEPIAAPPPPRADGSPPIRIVAIAASTGGPAALQLILGKLPADFPVPILIVQHIAAGFVAGLAHWLNAAVAVRVKVGEDGELLSPGVAYIAPDGQHLGVRGEGRLLLSDTPPVGGFRPSASYLFESAARRYGRGLAAVILTGMGQDGVAGLRKVRAVGGHVLAQDEATSVVYGMPREAVRAGIVDAVLPLDRLGQRLIELVGHR